MAPLRAGEEPGDRPRLANQPTPERGRYLLSPILFPFEQPPATTQPE